MRLNSQTKFMKKIFSGKYYLIATIVVNLTFWVSMLSFNQLGDTLLFGLPGDILSFATLTSLFMIFFLVLWGMPTFFITESEKKHAIIGALINLSMTIFLVWAYFQLQMVPLHSF